MSTNRRRGWKAVVFWWAVTGVLVWCGGSLWADYLVFRINIGEVPQAGPVAGAPGVPGQPGFPGLGGPNPGGGFPGGFPGGGFPGGGFPGGGFPGGAPGFPPGGGVPGAGPGGEGIPGQPGANPPTESAGSAEWFLAVLPGEIRPASPRGPYVFRYDGGQFQFQPGIGIADLAEVHVIAAPTLSREFEELTKKAGLANKAPAEFVRWMLHHWTYRGSGGFDMLKRFEDQLLAWEKMGLEKLPEADRSLIRVLLDTRQMLKQELPEPHEVLARVASQARGYVYTSKEHYTVIHLQRDQKQAEDLLNRLEQLFHGVYYWFASQGKPLPLPPTRLVAWLAESAATCGKLQQALNETRHLQVDGFYSRLEKVFVVAPHRLDAGYARLQARIRDIDVHLAEAGSKLLSPFFGGQPVPPEYTLSLEKLAKPDANMKKVLGIIQQMAQKDPSAMAALGLAYILLNSSAAIYEEGIVATITHEGTRQILDAVGLLPARAGFPENWRDGLLALLETPKSNGEFRAPAFYSGLGNVHWVYLPVFNFFANEDRVKKGEVVFYEKTPREVTIPVKRTALRDVVRGTNYQQAFQAKPEQRDLLWLKARAESWALVYFLAATRWPKLLQFYDELARLPRDMEISPEVIEHIFAMTFELTDAQGRPDLGKLEQLEEEWRKFMSKQSLPLRLPAYVDAKPATPANKPGLPGVPGVPPGGGAPMP